MCPEAGAGFRQELASGTENTHRLHRIPRQKPKSLLHLTPFPGIHARKIRTAQAPEGGKRTASWDERQGVGAGSRQSWLWGSDFQDL